MPTGHVLALMGAVSFAWPVAATATDVAPSHAPSLEEELAPLMGSRAIRKASVAVQVVNLRTGEEVFGRNADQGMVSASTMKIVTAAASLRALGPSYRFETQLLTDGQLDSTGVLQGNLYVRGHGDPTFVVERLWKLVYDLKLEGVERIAGDVVYDESFFASDYMLPGWDKPEDLERGPSYFPTLSALSLNYNTVSLVVAPGAEVGAEGRVVLETPAESYVTVENQVSTGPAGSWRSLEVDREVLKDGMRFVVKGSVPLGWRASRIYRSVAEPTSHFAAAFEEMLAQHDIFVTGKHRRDVTPESADLLVSQRSRGLGAILMDMNKYSNNFIAEQVLRTLGAEVKGLPGTTRGGLEAVRDYLTSIGVDPKSYTLINGSGLTRGARIPPSLLTAVLVDMAHDPQVGHEFAASLAIAGRDGTLWQRLTDQPGKMRGKTGTIDGIHCLTGYLEGGDGDMYAFAFLANDVHSVARVKQLHDRFVYRVLEVGAEQPDVVDSDAN